MFESKSRHIGSVRSAVTEHGRAYSMLARHVVLQPGPQVGDVAVHPVAAGLHQDSGNDEDQVWDTMCWVLTSPHPSPQLTSPIRTL